MLGALWLLPVSCLLLLLGMLLLVGLDLLLLLSVLLLIVLRLLLLLDVLPVMFGLLLSVLWLLVMLGRLLPWLSVIGLPLLLHVLRLRPALLVSSPLLSRMILFVGVLFMLSDGRSRDSEKQSEDTCACDSNYFHIL